MALYAAKADIERKESEEELKTSERRYRELFDNMSSGVAVYEAVDQGQDFVIKDINRAGEQISQVDREDVVQKSLLDVFPGVKTSGLFAVFQRVWKTGKPEKHPVSLYKDNRISQWVENSVYKLPSGEVVAVYDDLTERERTGKELLRLGTAVEQAAESVIIANRPGTIQYINPAFERKSGYRRKEIIGQNFRVLKSDKHDEAFYKKMFQVISNGEIWSGRIVNRMKNGSLREFETRISPIHDRSGEIINFVSVNRDVTQEAALEAQLRQSQRMEAVGTLAGGIAHDFNNLMTTILGNAQIALAKTDQDDPLREELQDIKTAGERAVSLTRQLLAFSRKQIIQPQLLNLNKALAGMHRMLTRLIEEHVEIKTICEPELGSIKIDPAQIDQVTINLVTNARDAMPKGGTLTIETANRFLDEEYFSARSLKAQPGAYVLLSVSDTGSGMDKEIQKYVFEPFFTTKEVDKGTGLGLSTVYGIIKQNKGFIFVDSEPGRGSTFEIYLPVAADAPGPEEKETIFEHGPQVSESVLVVEDDVSLRKLICKVLRQQGYRALEAENSEDALTFSERFEGPIHLLVTDVVMPLMSGRELADRLLALRPEMKVIYMSGYTDETISHHGILEPDVNFIKKPFTPESLFKKIQEVLDQH